MSVFTNLLNLFKWEIEKDGEEEFDINKALNENWDKLDSKIDAHTKNTQLVHKNATANLSGFMSKEDKEKLDNIEKKAQHNIIEKLQKNGKDIPVVDKVINLILSKSDVGLDKVNNTSDLEKPISAKTKNALENKVDKEQGKGLSTNDYTNKDKEKLENMENKIKELKIDTIVRTQSFTFYNDNNIIGYNLQGISKSNLTKIELGYTTNETDEPQEYAEITETSGRLETNIENDGTIYLWIKLTYTDIGEVKINADNDEHRYSLYMVLGGSACFTGDTKVLTETGMKEIRNIKLNDKILTPLGIKTVTKKYEHIVNKIYRIKVENEEIKASYSHPFVTLRGIVIARDLKVGDILEDITGRKIKIKDIEIIEESTIVYEINTDANNYYITDSKILVASEVL